MAFPISLKDNIASANVRTTVGSAIFKDWVARSKRNRARSTQRGGSGDDREGESL